MCTNGCLSGWTFLNDAPAARSICSKSNFASLYYLCGHSLRYRKKVHYRSRRSLLPPSLRYLAQCLETIWASHCATGQSWTARARSRLAFLIWFACQIWCIRTGLPRDSAKLSKQSNGELATVVATIRWIRNPRWNSISLETGRRYHLVAKSLNATCQVVCRRSVYCAKNGLDGCLGLLVEG